MEYCGLGNSGMQASRLVLGCMRMGDKSPEKVEKLLETALESGINMFDHADIYGGGESERRFGEAFKKLRISRDRVIIQSKCGIRPGMYDFSRAHILSSVENSLKRLGTDYLDILLLHRPDALMDPEEVLLAFEELEKSGKVRHFGVSNFSASQIQLLSGGRYSMIADQLQFSLLHSGMIDEGLNVNTAKYEAVERGGNVLDYCRLNKITVQAWSPLNYGMIEGIFVESEKFPEVNRALNVLAEKYGCSAAAVAIAWILRHPAKMQTVVGTTEAVHLKELCKASEVKLTAEEWYELYCSTGKTLP